MGRADLVLGAGLDADPVSGPGDAGTGVSPACRRMTMSIKAAKDLVAAANAAVPGLSVDEAEKLVGRSDVQFVDVREPAEWEKGHVPGAVHVVRGLLEFKADPSNEAYHEKRLDPDKQLVVYCASGGRS